MWSIVCSCLGLLCLSCSFLYIITNKYVENQKDKQYKKHKDNFDKYSE